MNTTTVIITVEFPAETGCAAIAKALLDDTCDVHSLNKRSYEDKDKIIEILSGKTYDKAILIGTYVSPYLFELLDKFPKMKFYMYTFGDNEIKSHENLITISQDKEGPASFVVNIIKDYYKFNKNHLNLFLRTYDQVIHYIDDKLMNPVAKSDTYIFFTGLYNVENNPEELSVPDKFMKLFLGDEGYDLGNIMEVGKVVIRSNELLALEAAKKNSCLIEIDGKRYAVGAHVGLTGLIHDKLRKIYGDDIVTIVPTLKMNGAEFMEGNTHVLKLDASLSLKNLRNNETDRNNGINILGIAQRCRGKDGLSTGGGSHTVAGGTVKCVLDFPIVDPKKEA